MTSSRISKTAPPTRSLSPELKRCMDDLVEAWFRAGLRSARRWLSP